jgi:hypothetical protein
MKLVFVKYHFIFTVGTYARAAYYRYSDFARERERERERERKKVMLSL